MTAAGSPPDNGATSYRFGDFELRLATRELRRAGAPVELQPKVFDFVAYLLAHRDRVVGKDELFAAVWPGQVVTESALTRCARRARAALDDSAEQPWAIHTVHGRGYRFIAPVQPLAEVPAVPAGAAPVEAPRRALDRRLGAGLAALLLVLALGWWLGEGGAPLPDAGPVRIAVLPVDNATGEARHDWARLGLMSSISEILRRQGSVRVLNPREVLATDEAAPLPARFDALQRRYGVSHVVEGRLERASGQLRLFYAVLDRDGERRERSVLGADVPALAHAVGADLRVLFGYQGARAFSADSFVNEAFLRGMAVRLQGDVEGALNYFRLAAEQAPEAFFPRYEIALGLRDLGRLDEAIAALETLRAEALRSGDAEARRDAANSLGVAYWRAGQLRLGSERLAEALQAAEAVGDPERVTAVLVNLGILHTYLGDYALARTHLNRAIESEANAGVERTAGAISNSLGQLDLREGYLTAAEQHLQAALDQFRLIGEQRNEAIVINGLGELRCLQGRYAEARELSESALPVHRRLGNRVAEAAALIGLSCAEAGLGRLPAAIGHAEAALALAEAGGNAQNAALARGLLGQHQRRRGDFAAARGWTESALAAHLASGDLPRARWERLQLARLALAEGDPDEAGRIAGALHGEALETGPGPLRAETLELLAQIRLAAGDLAAAADRLDQAQAEMDRLSHRRLAADLALTRAELHLAAGRPDEAEAALAAAGRLSTQPRHLRLSAALAAARGQHAAALALERAARDAAGEAWRPADQARLDARVRAAAR